MTGQFGPSIIIESFLDDLIDARSVQLTSVVRSSSISNDVSSAIKVVDRVQVAPFFTLLDIVVSADVGQFFSLVMTDSSILQFLS